ncbi:MAG: UDP-N-acetylmuramoyl-L-alanine--D-glutamate ligase [Treponema sp.]|jgi:UDP-N-acetylmuramoylalanine--D-glutamate ligase|nr:UDP-N-acetylmuramoyl-L-alanine--D-glutamate ligase [Treponema sp.]
MKYTGMRVLVMGLGLHGGGLESARYLAEQGAELTVTDLRDEKTLAPSLEKLQSLGVPVRCVLGRHEMADFEKADMVIKNPGVSPDSPFLKAARRIETDISLFLAASPARLTAVTGSKGKSGAASAIHWGLREGRKGAAGEGKVRLGGNITVSPLSFLDSLGPGDDVVLELSSWQLGDLRGRLREDGSGPLLKPRAAALTAIFPDHLDRYVSMEVYVADKRVIYQGQDRGDLTAAGDDQWGRSFLEETPGRPQVYAETPLPEGVSGGWLTGAEGPGLVRLYGAVPPGTAAGEIIELVPPRPLTPGRHQKKNLLAAALVLLDLGIRPESIRRSLETFPGIEHRLEFFREAGGVRFYNDTAATIPEAAAAAVAAFDRPPVLVAGGSDKNLDFGPLADAAAKVKTLILLEGSGTEKFKALLDGRGLTYLGPFDNMDQAAAAAFGAARKGDTVILSPGCASFGMFLNEFDRGRRWKEAVTRLA